MLKQVIKFVYGLALALLLAVNFALLPSPAAGANGEVSQAIFIPVNLKWGTAHYDTTAAANLIGCWGPPKDCLMLVGAHWGITLAPDGFHADSY